jgi:hypothetical protein
VKTLSGKIEMEHPNKLIDQFTGTIELDDIGKGNIKYMLIIDVCLFGFLIYLRFISSIEPILAGNVILRGCVLRNTDWIIGCVINTGKVNILFLHFYFKEFRLI